MPCYSTMRSLIWHFRCNFGNYFGFIQKILNYVLFGITSPEQLLFHYILCDLPSTLPPPLPQIPIRVKEHLLCAAITVTAEPCLCWLVFSENTLLLHYWDALLLVSWHFERTIKYTNGEKREFHILYLRCCRRNSVAPECRTQWDKMTQCWWTSLNMLEKHA